MKHQLHSQKKVSSTSQLTSAHRFQSRPFTPPTEASPQQQMPDLQTQRENAERLGHNFANIPILRPNASPPPIQPKLTIGQPGDKYEQEADAVARRVVSQMHAPEAVQREELPEEDEELMMKSDSGTIQREEIPEEDEEELQMKPMVQPQAEGEMAATPDLEASIQQVRGSGQPLSDDIREPMEQAFGADFSGVRVHTDGTSDALNQSIQAKAFTTGQDVFFRQGAYQPGSRGGQELIAHELTHVVQQNGSKVYRKPELKNANAQIALGQVEAHSSHLKPQTIIEKPDDSESEETPHHPLEAGIQHKHKSKVSQKLHRDRHLQTRLELSPVAPHVIQRGGKLDAVKNKLTSAGRSVKSGLKKGARKTGEGLKYFTVTGIKEGTGLNVKSQKHKHRNRAGRVTLNVLEGAANAFIAPLNPRWYYKAFSDVKGISADDYGGGKVGKVMQRLAQTSQIVQKAATLIGIAALIAGVVGAAGAGFGAGAPALAASAVLGFMGMILSGIAFILQAVLTTANIVQWVKTGDIPPKFWSDLLAGLGAALGVVAGGLGTNFGTALNEGGLSISGAATSSVFDPAIANYSEVGQQFAGAGFSQAFGTTGDAASETADVLQAAPEDENASPSTVAEPDASAMPTPEDLQEIASLVTQEATDSQQKSERDKEGFTKSLEAMDEVEAKMAMPIGSAKPIAKMKQTTQGADMPIGEAVAQAPQTLQDAHDSIDAATQDGESAKISESDSAARAKLDKANQDLDTAESELGESTTAEKAETEPVEKENKSGSLKRFKHWVTARVFKLKKRFKGLMAKVKAKVTSATMDVLGITEQVEALKVAIAEQKAQTPAEIAEAIETANQASQAQELAQQLGEAAQR